MSGFARLVARGVAFVGAAVVGSAFDASRKFQRGREIHERYMLRHGLDPVQMTAEQWSKARQDPDLAVAAGLYREALAAAETTTHVVNHALAHQQLGLLCLIRGELDESHGHCMASLTQLERAPFPDDENRTSQGANLYYLAVLATLKEDYAGAKAHLARSAKLNASLGDIRAEEQDRSLLKLIEQRDGG